MQNQNPLTPPTPPTRTNVFGPKTIPSQDNRYRLGLRDPNPDETLELVLDQGLAYASSALAKFAPYGGAAVTAALSSTMGGRKRSLRARANTYKRPRMQKFIGPRLKNGRIRGPAPTKKSPTLYIGGGRRKARQGAMAGAKFVPRSIAIKEKGFIPLTKRNVSLVTRGRIVLAATSITPGYPQLLSGYVANGISDPLATSGVAPAYVALYKQFWKSYKVKSSTLAVKFINHSQYDVNVGIYVKDGEWSLPTDATEKEEFLRSGANITRTDIKGAPVGASRFSTVLVQSFNRKRMFKRNNTNVGTAQNTTNNWSISDPAVNPVADKLATFGVFAYYPTGSKGLLEEADIEVELIVDITQLVDWGDRIDMLPNGAFPV